MKQKKTIVIGCAVLGVDIIHAARQLGLAVDFKFLEAGLHERPDVLKQKLQETIDAVSAAGEAGRIVIGYGVCGRGTIGIQSRDIPLFIPKVHDCIAMFLGGSEAYRREFKKFPGSYYISAGWYEEKAVPVSQRKLQAWYGNKRVYYDDIARQYGDQAADRTISFSTHGKRIISGPPISIPDPGVDQSTRSTPRRWPRPMGGRMKKLTAAWP